MKLSDIGPQYKIMQPTKRVCCPLNYNGHVPSTIHDTSVIVVMESPDMGAVRETDARLGQTGKMVAQSLKRYGVETASWTHLVNCEQPKKTKAACLDACLGRLMADVKGYPFVLLVGSAAANRFFPDRRNTHLRGNFSFHPDFPGQRFYCAYHPKWAHAGEGRENAEIYHKQMKRFCNFVNDQTVDFKVHRPSSPTFMEDVHEALKSKRICFDIETPHKGPWNPEANIRSVAFTNDGVNAYFCEEHDPCWTEFHTAIQNFLEDRSKQVVNHHLGFDAGWEEMKANIHVRATLLDTMTLFHHARDYRMPSLKRLVSEVLDGYKFMCVDPESVEDLDILAWYNAEDVIYAWRLFEIGIRELDKLQLDLYLNVASPSDLYTQRMHNNGIHVDIDHLHHMQEKLEGEREAAIQAWMEADPDFNPSVLEGDKSLKTYLFKAKGFDVIERTEKTGAPQVDKNVISILAEQAPYLNNLLEIRRIDKLLSTYIEGLKKHIDSDGRIHASYFNTWTDSGRFSSRNPNMQNIPRDPQIRKIFSVPAGYVFLDADYSQIELRGMLSVANDQTAIEAYRRGVDLHARTAEEMAGPNWTKTDRQSAKAVNFGLIYGGTEYTLMQSARRDYGMEMSMSEAAKFKKLFFDTYSALPGLHEQIIAELHRNRGWVQSPTGHIHIYDKWNHPNEGVREHVERSAINAYGQSPASYITAHTGIVTQRILRERGLYGPIKIINTVHDSISSQVEEGMVDTMIEIMAEANESTMDWVRRWFKVPLVMDFEVGQNWGEKKELEKKAVARV